MYQTFSQPAPIIFGRGAISVLGEKVKEKGCKKALIICEKGIEDAGIVAKAAASLDESGIAYVVFNEVLADPPDSSVDKAGAFALGEKVDCLIGVGGGSSLDTSKATSILMTYPGPVRNYIVAPPTYIDTKVPLILVPTTAGTGSECTNVAIISLPDKNVKWAVNVNTSLAIVDPELMLSLPKSITATTGMDALSHAMEAMTCINWNHHSDLYAEGAIKKIAANLAACCEDPGNIDARSEMALAANWAGLAFNNPVTHVGHAVADALSCNFHTAHGLNCALALPDTMALIGPAVPERMRVIAKAMGIALGGGETGEQLGNIVAAEIRALMRKIGIKSLSEMGYAREKVISFEPEVTASFLSDNCPVKIDAATAAKLLAAVYDNY
ncbi:MAG: iron-containing alcohol dehydrogenase [Oscillospiraceae bacterium]|nr:iron-containing alcohol dehydrogenase [Oscillospiraceae bacterium]